MTRKKIFTAKSLKKFIGILRQEKRYLKETTLTWEAGKMPRDLPYDPYIYANAVAADKVLKERKRGVAWYRA